MHLIASAGTLRRTALGMSALLVLSLSACGDDGGSGATAGTAAVATVGSVQTSGAKSPAGVTLLTPVEGAKLLASGGAVKVIDVRTPTEFVAGHLAEAVNIDLNGPTFESEVTALDKNATYFVYCQSGRRSALATQAMSDKGFTAVYELDGGIQAWLAAGQSVVTA